MPSIPWQASPVCTPMQCVLYSPKSLLVHKGAAMLVPRRLGGRARDPSPFGQLGQLGTKASRETLASKSSLATSTQSNRPIFLFVSELTNGRTGIRSSANRMHCSKAFGSKSPFKPAQPKNSFTQLHKTHLYQRMCRSMASQASHCKLQELYQVAKEHLSSGPLSQADAETIARALGMPHAPSGYCRSAN